MRAELRDIHKRFGPTEALAGASLTLEAGEVHALLGQNGAGKTTLVRILHGLVRPDRGEIRIDGRPVVLRGPKHALELGIGLVHQHFMLVPELSVAENLALGARGGPWLARGPLRAEARRVLEERGLGFDPDALARDLSVAERQQLEIARALARGVRLLVLDEPTAVLTPSEVDRLLLLIDRLRAEGRTVLFISHKLAEITAVCDRVTVLRDGRDVATRAVADVDAAELGRVMVGAEMPPPGVPAGAASLFGGEVALRARGLVGGGLRGVDFELRAGEVLAVAGIDGNGQQPLEEVLAGVRKVEAGSLEVARPPLAVVPADRQRAGLALGLSLAENLALSAAARGGREPPFRAGALRLVSPRALRSAAVDAIERGRIRARPDDTLRNLSGGNQQKVSIARALAERPSVLVVFNPTRGLDVGATAAVRDEIRAQARAGTAVLLASTDLDEVLELGDRVAVLFRGALTPVEPARRTRERIGELMLGSAA